MITKVVPTTLYKYNIVVPWYYNCTYTDYTMYHTLLTARTVQGTIHCKYYLYGTTDSVQVLRYNGTVPGTVFHTFVMTS